MGKKMACKFVLLTVLLSASLASRAELVTTSDFSNGPQDWMWPGDEACTSWRGEGGNPGGYIHFNNNLPVHSGYIDAPVAYLGDWTAADLVGSITYDFNIFDTGSFIGSQSLRRVIVSGPGGSARYEGGYIEPEAGWKQVQIPIGGPGWIIENGTWPAILANVTKLQVKMAMYTGLYPHEITGVDNISLSLPGPLPDSLTSWGAVKALYR